MFAFILITLCLSNTAAFGIWPTVNKFPIFQYLENFYEKNQFLPSKSILLNPKVNTFNITDDDKYQSQWYMIGRPTDFPFRVPRKVNIWGKNYVVEMAGSIRLRLFGSSIYRCRGFCCI